MAVRLATGSLTNTSGVPDDAAMTICGWGRIVTDTNAAGVLGVAQNGSLLLGVAVGADGTTLSGAQDAGNVLWSVRALSTGTDFFWAIASSGTAIGSATVYTRSAGENTFTSAANTASRTAFAPTTVELGNLSGSLAPFNGRLWNVKVWGRALSADELLVESYYRRVMYPSSLSHHWHLDRHDDLNDYSGNSRDLTGAGTLSTEDGAHGLWTPRRRIFLPAAAANQYTLPVDVAAYIYTANNAGLAAARKLAITTAGYIYTATDAGLKRGYPLVAATASYTLTANAAGLAAARKLAIDAAAYTLSASDAGLAKGFGLTADTAAYTLTANDAGLTAQRKLAVDTAAYTLTGVDVTLSYESTQKTLTAETASFTLAANDAALRATRALALDTASYSVTANDAGLIDGGRRLAAETASYALTAHAVDLSTTGAVEREEIFTGGFVLAYEREMERRRRERRRQQELEEEAERIEEETTRQIALLLREQEAKDARRAELQRLSALVARHADRAADAALAPRVQKAIRTAATKQTTWALFQLERELARAKEEEEFILQALHIALAH